MVINFSYLSRIRRVSKQFLVEKLKIRISLTKVNLCQVEKSGVSIIFENFKKISCICQRSGMKAILLAAGYGTRLKPLTATLPKCLMPIGGRPLLDIWIRSLIEAGVQDLLINTHYLANRVVEYVKSSSYPANILFTYEAELLGTGGTVWANREFISDHEPTLLVHADNLCLTDFPAFFSAHLHRPSDTCMTMMLFETDLPQSCGVVKLDDAGRVIEFHEKVKNPPSNLANAAVYIIEQDIVQFMESLRRDQIDFSLDVIPEFIGRIHSFTNKVYHRDIGTLESLHKAQALDKRLIRNMLGEAAYVSLSDIWPDQHKFIESHLQG